MDTPYDLSKSIPWSTLTAPREGLVGLTSLTNLLYSNNNNNNGGSNPSNSNKDTIICDSNITSMVISDTNSNNNNTNITTNTNTAAVENEEDLNPLWTPLVLISWDPSVRQSPACNPLLLDQYFADKQQREKAIGNTQSSSSSSNSNNLHRNDNDNASAVNISSSTLNTNNNTTNNTTKKETDDELFIFWWNRFSMQISTTPPAPPQPCRGGLLADEMVRMTVVCIFMCINIYDKCLY